MPCLNVDQHFQYLKHLLWKLTPVIHVYLFIEVTFQLENYFQLTQTVG